jgi:FkbM family methyltransferase
LPLTHGTIFLYWAIALSILGHDIDVKRAYFRAITSPVDRPDLFIDIGANTGTHSILFLVHGIDTICFEPNASCRQTLAALCEANGVLPRIEPYCLGARHAAVNLAFPARETWLGSVKPNVIEGLQTREDLIVHSVEQRMLDDYLPELSAYQKLLIKIDVEGAESDVLRGAAKLIEKFQPTLILEANGDRGELFTVMQDHLGYALMALPDRRPLNREEFLSAPAPNFMAKPRSRA